VSDWQIVLAVCGLTLGYALLVVALGLVFYVLQRHTEVINRHTEEITLLHKRLVDAWDTGSALATLMGEGGSPFDKDGD